jgi:DNA invertase Pin-like site-specific DNA recombinase
MEFVREGDELVVLKLDRLGRNTRDVLNLVHEVRQKGAVLSVLEPKFATTDVAGPILVTVLGMGRRTRMELHTWGISRMSVHRALKTTGVAGDL